MVKVATAADDSKTARSLRRVRVGTVTSDKGNKTITLVCTFSVKYPKYGKYVRRRTKLHAHDEKNEAAVGDRVEVMECRPMSKMKNWRLLRIVRRA